MGKIVLEEQAAPLTPAAGLVAFYPKTDSRLYYKDDQGTEHSVSHQPARKNVLINGAFDVWQRGTSIVGFTGGGAYGADRWLGNVAGTAVFNFNRSTDVPTVAEAGRLFNYSAHIDITTIDSAVTAGDNLLIQQRIEGFNWLPLAQKPTVLSFWVKATKTGIYCASLVNSGNDRSCVMEFTVNVTDTWEYKEISFPASPSAGTWDYTTGIGIKLTIALMMGPTFHTTAGSWQTGQYYSTANQVNGADNAANDFKITGIQFELGQIATDFEYRFHQDELINCKRYYQTGLVQLGSNGTGFASSHYGGSNAYYQFPIQSPMRASPTMSLSGNDGIQYYSFGGAWTATSFSVSVYGVHPEQFIVVNCAADGDGRGKLIRKTTAGNCIWVATAEL